MQRVINVLKGTSTPSNIASNIAGNSFHLTLGVQGGDTAGNLLPATYHPDLAILLEK